jgi:hypothetical protein
MAFIICSVARRTIYRTILIPHSFILANAPGHFVFWLLSAGKPFLVMAEQTRLCCVALTRTNVIGRYSSAICSGYIGNDTAC